VPLLERVRFLAIFGNNLDEFFMVRVAGRIRRMAAGLPVDSASGIAPDQLLANTLKLAGELASRHAACFSDSVKATHILGRAVPSPPGPSSRMPRAPSGSWWMSQSRPCRPPSTNPSTAVQVLDHLEKVLQLLGSTPLRGRLTFSDRDGMLRLVMAG
jgi:Polyphosphate kinase N-terminal domain